MKRNPFKAREYWREDTTWGEVMKGKMSKEEIKQKYCNKEDGDIDPYISMRLKALRYIGYTMIENMSGRTVATGDKVEPRKIDFMRVNKGERRSIKELMKEF